MITRTSLVTTICVGWTCVSLVYFASQVYIVMGMTTRTASIPIVLSLLILTKNVGEPLFERVLSKHILPDSIVKYVHKYPVLKTIGVVSVCSCSLFELTRKVVYGGLCLVSLVGAFAPDQAPIKTVGSIILRLTIGVVLVTKLPLEAILPRLVGFLSKETSAGAGISALLLGAVQCMVSGPWSSPPAMVTHTVDTATTEATTGLSDNTPTATTPLSLHATKGGSPPTGSATLLAVLLAAAAEAAVLWLALACPLLLDLLESTDGAGLQTRIPLMTAARHFHLRFSRVQCAWMVLGAAVQCAALMFAAGYLSHRRAIALELRTHAAATAIGTPRGPASSTASPSFSLGAFLLSLLDCDVRLNVCLESSRGDGRLSSVDAFAAGLQSATGVPTSAVATQPSAASTLPSPTNGNGNGKAGGKARLSVVIPPGGANGNSSSPRKESPRGVEKAAGAGAGAGAQRTQFAPQPHVLLVCVLPVLAVAVLQTAVTVLGLTDSRCSGGSAVTALASVLLVTYLRDAVPRASVPFSGTTGSGGGGVCNPLSTGTHSAAGTPQAVKH